MNGLDVIDGGEGVFVTVKGEKYAFGALKLGKLPSFARAIKPLISEVNKVLSGSAVPSIDYLADLIADHGDSLLEAISIATNIPRKVLDEAEIDTLAEVLPPVLAVNKDFLISRLAPALQAAAKQITMAASPGTGPTP